MQIKVLKRIYNKINGILFRIYFLSNTKSLFSFLICNFDFISICPAIFFKTTYLFSYFTTLDNWPISVNNCSIVVSLNNSFFWKSNMNYINMCMFAPEKYTKRTMMYDFFPFKCPFSCFFYFYIKLRLGCVRVVIITIYKWMIIIICCSCFMRHYIEINMEFNHWLLNHKL